MDDRPYRLLLHGIDTLQCTYSLYPADHRTMDFENLRILKEDLREAKVKELDSSDCRNSWEMLRSFDGRKGRANHENNSDKNHPRGLHPLRPLVIDMCVLVSAFAFGGTPREAVRKAVAEDLIFVSPDLLREYREVPAVLSKKNGVLPRGQGGSSRHGGSRPSFHKRFAFCSRNRHPCGLSRHEEQETLNLH